MLLRVVATTPSAVATIMIAPDEEIHLFNTPQALVQADDII